MTDQILISAAAIAQNLFIATGLGCHSPRFGRSRQNRHGTCLITGEGRFVPVPTGRLPTVSR
jgi:hypothetical protein